MRNWFSTLASLKLTVILVVLIAVVLAGGTIIESLRGAEAGRAVYYSPFFFVLQGVFALNLAAALVERWPRNRYRIGYALTHCSMLLILAGALGTWLYKIEGQLALWEGQESTSISVHEGPGMAPLELPFKIRLDAFEMDFYPGTMRPAMFRSRVTVFDPPTSAGAPAVIEMNKPLVHGGYHFFQSSYRQEGGREATILSVARDPGQPIVFVGYTLLVLGMIVVFATRLVQHREAERQKSGAAPNGSGVTAGALALLLALGGGLLAAAEARAAEIPDPASVAQLRTLPVQHDGRTMPFDTEARESVWKVTGHRAWPGIDPVAMALGWSFDPSGWATQPIVKVGGRAVAEALALPAGTRYASFNDLVQHPALGQAVAAARQRQEADEKVSPIEKDFLSLEERLGILEGFFRGQALRVLPGADPQKAWQPAPGARSAVDLVEVGRRLRAGTAPPHYPTPDSIALELGYNARRPTRIAWIVLLVAAVAAGFAQTRERRVLDWIAGATLLAGFAVMSWGIATRWQLAGHIPASNMFESMLFLGWGVGLFGVVALVLRQRLLVSNAAGIAATAMLLSDLLPIDPYIHPMPPVLSGTPWLAIHVPIVVISYSVFAMATVIGHLVIGVEIFAPARRALAARWSELLYWYLHVGSILLIAGILTGSIWAASSWGRYWGWDPKEVWSLVAFLAYMAILHARFDAQLRSFGVAVASIAAFWTILMTYLGVNFVLASGLHTYGFASSRMVRVMTAIAAVESAFLLWGWAAYRRRRSGRLADAA